MWEFLAVIIWSSQFLEGWTRNTQIEPFCIHLDLSWIKQWTHGCLVIISSTTDASRCISDAFELSVSSEKTRGISTMVSVVFLTFAACSSNLQQKTHTADIHSVCTYKHLVCAINAVGFSWQQAELTDSCVRVSWDWNSAGKDQTHHAHSLLPRFGWAAARAQAVPLLYKLAFDLQFSDAHWNNHNDQILVYYTGECRLPCSTW